MTKASTKAYLRKLLKRFGETTPILLRKYMTIGSSNVTPTQKIKLAIKSIKRSAVHSCQKISFWKPPRNAMATGTITKKQKAAPIANDNVTPGTAMNMYFFSFSYRAGATNDSSWYTMTG